MDLVTREEAKVAGSKLYYTGKACPSGHIAQRYVSNYECEQCSLERYKGNSEVIKKRSMDWYFTHPEEVRVRRRKWKKANPDILRANRLRYKRKHKEKGRAQTKRWYIANIEIVREKRRLDQIANSNEWAAIRREKYAANPILYRETSSRWRLAHLDAVRAKAKAWAAIPGNASAGNQRRRALMKGVAGRYFPSDISDLLLIQNRRCCGPNCSADISTKFTVDHIIPISRGGSNWPDNIQLMCRACNSSKGRKTMEEWLAMLEFRKKSLVELRLAA